MLVRVAPFLVFVGLTSCQGAFGEASRYWFYLIKTFAGAGMVWAIWPRISEMRWRASWDAILVGVVVFLIWVGLDGRYPSADSMFKTILCPLLKPLGFEKWCSVSAKAVPWNPHAQFGFALAWVFAIVRLLGSVVVVPPLEEVFYRSFLYRFIARQDFQAMPLNQFRLGPFLIAAAIFGFSHYEWLPGILCGMLYHGLVLRHNRLGEAMTAHAVTNFLLGLWVISRSAWHFW